MDNNESFLRRGRVAPKRRRLRHTARRIAAVAVAVAAAVLLVRFLGGSLFSLERFDISGNERARTADILAALSAW